MTQTVYYTGSEALAEVGFQGESNDKTDVSTAVTPTVTLAYLQSLSVNPNENLRSLNFINTNNGINRSHELKGPHKTTAKMSFWLPKNLDQANSNEYWLLKMGVDGSSTTSEATPDTQTIPATTNEFGGGYLKVMTIECGYNKSGSITAHKLTGCIVNKFNFHAEEEKECLWTYDMIVMKAEKATAFTSGALVESTQQPFNWGDVQVKYGAANSAAAIDNVRMIDFNIDYTITSLFDLNNATSTRFLTAYIVRKRNISGTFKIDLTTATSNGQDLWEVLYNDSSGTATPTAGVTLQDLVIVLYMDSTYSITYNLNDVTIGELPEEIVGEDVPSITVPFTATSCVLVTKNLGTQAAPSGWA